MHAEVHPDAGRTVVIKDGVTDPAQNQVVGGAEYRIEDWWDRVSGGSWMYAEGNPAALHYAMRSAVNGLPTDDEVVYGKIGHLGHLVHVSELGAEVPVVTAYFSRVGLPIDEQCWLHFTHHDSYRFVAEDVTTTDIEVTTLWRGWRDSYQDRRFETVVRHSEGQFTLPWPSETEALANHRWLVAELGGAR